MKRFVLALLVIGIALHVNGQRSILFKIKYLPNHVYQANVSMTSNIEMNIENLSKQDSAKMIEKGIILPFLANISTLSDLTILTGTLNVQNTFPVTFRFNDVKKSGTLNGNKIPAESTAVSGHSVYATSTLTNVLQLDSMSVAVKDTALRKNLESTFNAMVTELRLPEKMIKVGDTFTQEIPFNMPMNGTDLAITVTATYKLTSIKKGVANFDIEQSSQFGSSDTENSPMMTGKGGGHGEMTYDIKRNFPKTISRDLLFDFQMKYKGKQMKAKAKINSFYFYSVADNRTN